MKERETKIRGEYEARIAEYERRIREFESPPAPSPRAAPQPLALSDLLPRIPDQRAEVSPLRGELAATHAQARFAVQWNAIENTYRDVMEVPGAAITMRALALDAALHGLEPARAIAEVAKQYRRFLVERDALAERGRAKAKQHRIVPAGRKGSALSGEPRKSGKLSIGERIAAALADRRKDG
jgi:hypothetical protein